MKRVREIIVVEGRYDKNAVMRAVECTVVETSGFGIFKNNEAVAMLRTLGEKRGLVILTDSDRAGFFIRGRLGGMLGGITVKHAYIPDIKGRERRKRTSSREGKLGVEGMERDIIIKALERAGATFEDCQHSLAGGNITKSDMYTAGLSGGEYSTERRRAFAKSLGLPERLSSNSFLQAVNALLSREEFYELCKQIRV